jgi:hypothetical protein
MTGTTKKMGALPGTDAAMETGAAVVMVRSWLKLL